MASLKLVRCVVRRPGTGGAGSPRFVPLEIFGLWEYLMAAKNGFEVGDPRASLWLDLEDSPEAAYGENEYERVNEITLFVYSSRDDMFTRVCRYLPAAESERLKPLLLAHYANGGGISPQVREKTGIWLKRTVETAAGAPSA